MTVDPLYPQVSNWVGVKSPQRRRRLMHKLINPAHQQHESDEHYTRVSGLSRAYLYGRLTAVSVILVLEVGLLLLASNLRLKVPSIQQDQPQADPSSPTRRSPLTHPHKLDPGTIVQYRTIDNQPFVMAALALLAVSLLIGIAYMAFAYVRWSAMFIVLSDYALMRVSTYPSWMFWFGSDVDTIDLENNSSVDYSDNVWGRLFGGFGHLQADNPGDADDKMFNHMPVVPEVADFHKEIRQVCRAITPAEAAQTKAIVDAIASLPDEIAKRLSQQ